MIETVSALVKRGVGFRRLTEAIDTTTPGGRLVFHLFGALGQFERDLIRERTRAGLAAAATRGRKGGRKPVITTEKLKRAREGSGAKWRSRSAKVMAEPVERRRVAQLKRVEEPFVCHHFDCEVIILCVRWYLRFKLSLRDLVEIIAERGLLLAHTTIMRWVQHYAPEFEKRWRRFGLAVAPSWRVDETYVKIRGTWCYLYRAVDRAGRTVDFRLSAHRDFAAAQAFFRKAIKGQGCTPKTITLDG